MTIRPATIKDLESIKKLNSKAFVDNTLYDSDALPHFSTSKAGSNYFAEALNRKDGCFFVAEDKGKLIGYVNGGAREFNYRQSKYFEIENLGVIPSHHRQGIGTQLLESITQWARDHGFQKIYIESYANNIGAIAFYQHHQYQPIDICLEKTIAD